jgi:hypothetical protein
MTQQYCTLFDSYYLSRALVMYNSLVKHCPDFHLYVFAFDDRSESILKQLSLPHVTVIALSEFENQALLEVKPGRTKGEYCWTCTPSIIDYSIKRFGLNHCTYIDADLYFFSNPKPLLDEMRNDSVMITEHRYTRKYEQSTTSGIYCVQFVTFVNDDRGMKALTWWRDKCIEWCFDRFEDGKFGDQKYLDDWTTRFKGVHVLQHLGGGVAPWNVQQYEILKTDKGYLVTEKSTGNVNDLVFYHFHALRFLKNGAVDLGTYRLSDDVIDIYKEYLINIERANQKLRAFGFEPITQLYQTKKSIPHILHKAARWVMGVYNVYKMNNLIAYGKNS